MNESATKISEWIGKTNFIKGHVKKERQQLLQMMIKGDKKSIKTKTHIFTRKGPNPPTISKKVVMEAAERLGVDQAALLQEIKKILATKKVTQKDRLVITKVKPN